MSPQSAATALLMPYPISSATGAGYNTQKTDANSHTIKPDATPKEQSHRCQNPQEQDTENATPPTCVDMPLITLCDTLTKTTLASLHQHAAPALLIPYPINSATGVKYDTQESIHNPSLY